MRFSIAGFREEIGGTDDVEDMGELAEPQHSRNYRPDIDGLRCIAIFSVVLYHAGVQWVPGGFTGVDVFFTLSGYLIGGHIYTDLMHGRFRFAAFYQGRAKRILPPLYVVLASLLAAGLLLLSPYELREVAKSAFAAIASVSNLLLWTGTGYFSPQADRNPLLMTWSLAVEEQFYLVVPILLVWLVRWRVRLVLPAIGLVAAVSFGLSCVQIDSAPMAAFYLLPARAWELALGVALAIGEAQAGGLRLREPGTGANLTALAGLALILGPFWWMTTATRFPGPAALPSVVGCGLLLAASGSWLSRKVLSFSPLVFVGRVSYAWYLWHWPLLAFLRMIYGAALPPPLSLLAIGVAFGLAVVSYQWIEKPFRSAKTAVQPMLLRYAAVSLIFLGGTFLLWRSDGWMGRYPALAAIDSTELAVQQDACLAGPGEWQPRLAPACTQAGSAMPQVALWGDSHAAALSPALRTMLLAQGYDLQVYAKTTCPPLLGAGRAPTGQLTMAKECIATNNAVMQRLLADPRVKVVALEAFWEAAVTGPSQLVASGAGGEQSKQILAWALCNTVQQLQRAGKRVILFDDVPVFGIDPIWRMRTAGVPLRHRLQQMLHARFGTSVDVDPGSDFAEDETLEQQHARALVTNIASGLPGLATWSLRQQLCAPQGRCLYRVEQTALYIDTNHLTYDGGKVALRGWTLAFLP